MTTQHDFGRQLQMKMSQLRGQITEESEEAAVQTRRALDWKHQISSHPTLSAAVAIALGYWLVPRRKSFAGTDSLVKIQSLLDNQTRQSTAGSGMGKTLALAAGSWLIKSLASGVVSKAITSLESWRDQRLTEHQASGSKQGLKTAIKGKPDDN
jgi:hypothetical protein